MHYLSTRGHNARLHFSAIVLEGLAPDGGLYLPERYPVIEAATLADWGRLPYPELAFALMRRFIAAPDLPDGDLRRLIDKTYSPEVFRFAAPGSSMAGITPLYSLGVENGSALSLLELSNGPTLAFKDIALQFLGNLFEYLLQRRGEGLNIVGATSGDTGSAAEYALRGRAGIRVFMLSPQGRMSPFQCAQMFSLQDQNIFNLAVADSGFDQCQDLVKAVNNDAAFKRRYRIGSINSINWARVLAQIVYYFSGYFQAVRQAGLSIGAKVDFTVPSGNFGNVCAGHIARMMGLPINKLAVATNENDVLDQFFETGIYQPRSVVAATSSPSMDIAKASNFERFVADLLGRDSGRLATLYAGNGFDLSAELPRIRRDFGFVSGASSHAIRLSTIADVYQRYQRLIDPHTADGVAVARRHLTPGIPMVVLETAQPAKFNQTIEEAIGRSAPRPAALEGIENLPQRVLTLANDVAALKDFIATECGGSAAG